MMRGKKYLLCITMFLASCSEKLLLPVKDGRLATSSVKSYGAQSGFNFFVDQGRSNSVLAAEKSTVSFVKMIDNSIVIYAKGNYQVWYSNLKQSLVKEGDRLEKGQTIGFLEKVSDSSKAGASLILVIQNEKNRYITSTKVFRKSL